MRRVVLILASCGALLAPALAVEIAPVRAAPGTLALPFVAAMPVALVVSAPALAPAAFSPALSASAWPAAAAASAAASAAAASPAAAAVPSFEPVPREVLAAFRSGDPQAYLAAARRADYEPPETDDAQSDLYQRGLEQEQSDRAFFASLSAPAAPRPVRRTKIDYAEFGRRLASSPEVSLDVFRDSAAKRQILRASGYDVLIGKGGLRIPLDQASDARVGQAFLHVKRIFDRR